MAEKHRASFKEVCLSCHGPDKQKGRFRVDQLTFAIKDIETAKNWQKVLNQMNSGEVPPDDEKKPSTAARTDFLDEQANVMIAARKTFSDQNANGVGGSGCRIPEIRRT